MASAISCSCLKAESHTCSHRSRPEASKKETYVKLCADFKKLSAWNSPASLRTLPKHMPRGWLAQNTPSTPCGNNPAQLLQQIFQANSAPAPVAVVQEPVRSFPTLCFRIAIMDSPLHPGKASLLSPTSWFKSAQKTRSACLSHVRHLIQLAFLFDSVVHKLLLL